MRFLIIIASISIYIFFESCETKTDVDFVLHEYQKNGGSKRIDSSQAVDSLRHKSGYLSIFYFYINEKPSIIYGKLHGENYGHAFFFNKKGQIDKYEYVIGEVNAYVIKRSDLTNEYNEVGSPYVHHMISKNEKTNEQCLDFLFSAFPRKNIQAYVSVNASNFKQISIIDSDLFPMLKTSNTCFNIGDKVILKVESSEPSVQLNGLENRMITSDTFIIEEPHMHK